MSKCLLSTQGVKKSFKKDGGFIEILHGLDFEVKQGESVAIIGGSGAGKSTFLHILGTLDTPSTGEVFFKGQNITHWSDFKLAEFRNSHLGFVFQFHHLLPEFSALENVMMPCLIKKMSKKKAKSQAEKYLNILGLKNRLSHYPSQLSGGEQQRVAIARALVLHPAVILADEPTGNLDIKNTQQIQQLFLALVEKFDSSVVVVTHDTDFAQGFSRVLEMKDGRWSHSL